MIAVDDQKRFEAIRADGKSIGVVMASNEQNARAIILNRLNEDKQAVPVFRIGRV